VTIVMDRWKVGKSGERIVDTVNQEQAGAVEAVEAATTASTTCHPRHL
jgi:hypothetical protein